MAKEELKYEAALAEIESIAASIESGTCNVDDITAKIKRAQQLISFCREKLQKVEKELKTISK